MGNIRLGWCHWAWAWCAWVFGPVAFVMWHLHEWANSRVTQNVDWSEMIRSYKYLFQHFNDVADWSIHQVITDQTCAFSNTYAAHTRASRNNIQLSGWKNKNKIKNDELDDAELFCSESRGGCKVRSVGLSRQNSSHHTYSLIIWLFTN